MDPIEKPAVIEPEPPTPAQVLIDIITQATMGLLALTDEHEGNLRSAVEKIDADSTALAVLVASW